MRSSKPAELLVRKHAIQYGSLMRPGFALFNVSLDVLVRMASYAIAMVIAYCRLNVQICQKNLLSLCQVGPHYLKDEILEIVKNA